MEITISTIAVTIMFGMFVGAGIMFRIMYKENNALETDLDVKTDQLQNLDKHFVDFARFNTNKQHGCKNAYEKLNYYKQLKNL